MKCSMSRKLASDLLAHGRSHVKGLYSARTGKTFDADLVLTETTNKDGQRIVSYELDFPKNSKSKKGHSK